MKKESDSNSGFYPGAIQASALSNHAIAYQSTDTNSFTGMIPARNSGGLGIVPVGTSNDAGSSSGATPTENSGCGLLITTVPGLKHETGMNVEWSFGEQKILEEGLAKFAELESINRYIKIAALLPDKTVRDVAFRCQWMTKKDSGKRRRPEDLFAGRKMKERQEKLMCSPSMGKAPLASHQNINAYSFEMQQKEYRNLNSFKALSRTRDLLDANALILDQISANLSTAKIQDNIDLLRRARSNLISILNDMREAPGKMSQMPPLSVSIDDNLFNAILPRTAPMQSLMFGNPMNPVKQEPGY